MGKLGWTAIIVFCAVVAADQHFNDGYVTDGAFAMLRQIRYAFGW